ncbi:MAG TPA: hypothetical protein ENN07_03415 [candidate division Zixibacteria bacterium]|nr:hypothetical protein [candidate division Zixibacteria bacterium]
MALVIDKERALIYVRMVEKLVLLVAKYSKSPSVDNIIREKNYYAHIVKNPPETPLVGLTTYAGMIKNIPLPSEPTIAIMLSGKGPTIDTDFYKKPIEIYYIIEDEVKEVSEDAGITITQRGFKYVRPRVGEPVVELAIDSIEKLALLIVLELNKLCERKG